MGISYCIYGASGHSKVIIEILEDRGEIINELYDDDVAKKILLGYKISNGHEMFKQRGIKWIIGIGDNRIRQKIATSHFLEYGLAIDKSSKISKRAEIGEGTVIMPGVAITSSSAIGRHAIINTNSSIDHDCIIGDYVHISPNAALCGGITLGEGTHIGAGAVIIPGIKIGKWVTIGAGAVIIKDVPDYSTVVGNPGRVK